MPSPSSVQVRHDRCFRWRRSRWSSSSLEWALALARADFSCTVRRESVSAPSSSSPSASGFSLTAAAMVLAFRWESLPFRTASSTPGWDLSEFPSCKVSMASPSDSPVWSASHSAAVRRPVLRWILASAARVAARVMPASTRRSSREKEPTIHAASDPLTQAGSKVPTKPLRVDSRPNSTALAPFGAPSKPPAPASPVPTSSVLAPPGACTVMESACQEGVSKLADQE